MYRLYRPERVIVHTEYAAGIDVLPCLQLAQAWWADNNTDDCLDAEYSAFSNGANQFWVHIKVLDNVLKGEYTTREAAVDAAWLRDYEEYTIVEKDSADDHDIRNGTFKAR